jgi:hypothetical protein
MKHWTSLLIVPILLVGCAQTQSPPITESQIQTAIAQTIAVPTNNVESSPTIQSLPTDTLEPTVVPTSPPTYTPEPTPEPTTVVAKTDGKLGKNYIASQESGGVVVEIVRIVIAEKTAIDNDFSGPEGYKEYFTIYEDKPVVIEFIFKITNKTNEIISLYVDQGKAVVNGEPIEFVDYYVGSIGDEIGGDFLPGTVAIGGLWTGIKRTPYDQVTNIAIAIDGPRNQDFASLGDKFYFEIDTTGWGYEEMPEELK